MAALNPDEVLAYLDEEIPPAIAWLQYHRLDHTWNREHLSLSVALEGLGDREGVTESYRLVGWFPDYRATPATWRFVDPRDGRDVGQAAYPAAGDYVPGAGSVLHSNGVICAAWNRLAYGDMGGPHSDWPNPAAWQSPIAGQTQAFTIADMLSRLFHEVAVSPRRLAPLPPYADQRDAS